MSVLTIPGVLVLVFVRFLFDIPDDSPQYEERTRPHAALLVSCAACIPPSPPEDNASEHRLALSVERCAKHVEHVLDGAVCSNSADSVTRADRRHRPDRRRCARPRPARPTAPADGHHSSRRYPVPTSRQPGLSGDLPLHPSWQRCRNEPLAGVQPRGQQCVTAERHSRRCRTSRGVPSRDLHEGAQTVKLPRWSRPDYLRVYHKVEPNLT